jgi:hypothetical protein
MRKHLIILLVMFIVFLATGVPGIILRSQQLQKKQLLHLKLLVKVRLSIYQLRILPFFNTALVTISAGDTVRWTNRTLSLI